MGEQADVLFYETQKFRQLWIWIILIAVFLIVTGAFGYGIVQQIVLEKPWGDKPLPDTALLVVGIGAIVFCGLLLFLFTRMTLVTEVRKDGLYIKFFPFLPSFRKISLESIKNCEVKTYSAIKEYGGWGVRIVKDGKAYTVSGDKGVCIDYQDDKHMLIGSQKPVGLLQAIETVLGRDDANPTARTVLM